MSLVVSQGQRMPYRLGANLTFTNSQKGVSPSSLVPSDLLVTHLPAPDLGMYLVGPPPWSDTIPRVGVCIIKQKNM